MYNFNLDKIGEVKSEPVANVVYRYPNLIQAVKNFYYDFPKFQLYNKSPYIEDYKWFDCENCLIPTDAILEAKLYIKKQQLKFKWLRYSKFTFRKGPVPLTGRSK